MGYFFSVVIPTFNRSALLKRAVESVLQQTFQDFELLICDDASTDNTPEVVSRFVDSRIKYHRLPANRGNAGTRNLGAQNSTGQYVTYLDSDDAYHPNFLAEMHRLIVENSNPGFLWSGVNRMTADGEIVNPEKPYAWTPESAKDAYAYFLNALYFGTDCGFTVRRNCFDVVGYFDENLRVAVDTDFILRIVQHFNFAYTKERLLDTYEHGGERVRKNTAEKSRSYGVIIEKHKAKIEANPKLVLKWYYKLMWLSYHSNDKKNARRYWYYFMKHLKLQGIVVGMIFELLPLDLAIRMHQKLSHEKRRAR